jgi:hypothetical protein
MKYSACASVTKKAPENGAHSETPEILPRRADVERPLSHTEKQSLVRLQGKPSFDPCHVPRIAMHPLAKLARSRGFDQVPGFGRSPRDFARIHGTL